MLSLSKKTDYALIALAYLAERNERTISAREIAAAYTLPLALLMNILKELTQNGLVKSVRGTKGGYRLSVDPHGKSLYDLIQAIEGQVQTTECVPGVKDDDSCQRPEPCKCRVSQACPVQAPLQALHYRLVRFLKDVKLSDLILPGHRIDVPLESVGVG